MRKTVLVLLIAAIVVGLTGIASARMGGYGGYYAQQSADGDWFDQMYQWMGQHMGRWGGPMMGYGQYGAAGGFCSGYGAGYYQGTDTVTEPVTTEEAEQLIEDAVEGTVTSEIYQMGRWYVAFYEDTDGKTRQARVDIFSGEVYPDFYEYMSEYSGVYNDRRYAGPGGMMWG